MLESIRAQLDEFWRLQAPKVLHSVVTILVILIVAGIIHKLVGRLTAWILRPRNGKRDPVTQQRRIQTLLPLLVEIERYVIYALVGVMILAHFGIDTAAILASVGVVGIALGFGAQNLVKDMIAGFFLLFDGIIAVGDIIRIDEKTVGTVEAVGLRNTQVRDFTGMLWMIPNGDLRQFGNLNRGWMRAVVLIDVAYEADVAQAMMLAREVGEAWAAANREKVLEPPDVNALMAMSHAAVTLRLVIKVKPGEQWAAERALRLMIKDAYRDAKIQIPYPRHVLIGPQLAGVEERPGTQALEEEDDDHHDESHPLPQRAIRSAD